MSSVKRFLIHFVLVSAVLVLSACDDVYSAVCVVKSRLMSSIKAAVVGYDEAVVRYPMVVDVKVIENISYGKHKKQRLDVYAPVNAQHAPVIMVLRGGGWASGNKEDQLSYVNKVNRWVPKGFVVVSADTRLLPDADVYLQIDDLAMAVAAVQKRAAEWGGDGSKVILMGHSSAGTMVSVLAANPTIVSEFGGKPWLASFALDSTSLDIPRSMRLWSPALIATAYGKDPKHWFSASPINLLNKESIPMFVACSTQRGDGPCEQAELFAAEAQKKGVKIKVVPLGFNHGGVDFNLGLDVKYTRIAEGFMSGLDSEVARLLERAD